MLAFVIMDGIGKVLALIILYYYTIVEESKYPLISWIVSDVIVTAIAFYLFIVCYSLYKTMVEEQNADKSQQVEYEAPTTQMQKAISEV